MTMQCPKCKSKMSKVNLKFSCFVGRGNYKYAYYCENCQSVNTIRDKKIVR